MPHVLAQDLRNAVLQAAIQGRLTEQLSTDSDPNALFSNIGFVDGKTIKRKQDNHLAKVSESDITIDIPENWIICRVGDLVSSIDAGKSPKCKNESCSDKEWGVIKTTAIQDNYFVRSENKVLSKSFEIKEKYIIHKNDFLITRAGPRNRTGVICIVNEEPQNLILSDKTLRFNLKHEYVLPAYLRIALRSPFGQSNIEKYMVGMAASQVNISQDNMKLFTIPLPPIEEQARIVARVDELMAKIDEYEKIEKELTELQKAFPRNMKDAILQAAMQGKLTEQLESDGSVRELESNLVKKMKATLSDKAFKKSKAFEDITDEEIPFDIPDNWNWIRFGKLASVLSGTSYDKANITKEGVRIIRGGNLENMKLVSFDNDVYLPKSFYDKNKVVKKSDIVVVASTGSITGIGRPAFADNTPENEMQIGAFLRIIRLFDTDLFRYCKYIFMSDYYRSHISNSVAGIGIRNLKEEHITKMLIPLPPLEEQQRIVDKLDQLLPLCEQLEKMAA